MELSWFTKTKITGILVLGSIIYGVLLWPQIAPEDPMAPATLWGVSWLTRLFLVGLAFGIGFISYFIGWPYGREVGLLGVPAGLGIIGLRGGNMTSLMQNYTTVAARQDIYSALRWEPLFWLLLVGVGYGGVRVATSLRPSNPTKIPKVHHETNDKSYLQGLLSIGISMIVAFILIGAFARNVPIAQRNVATQPQDAQIAFALCVAFGGAAFVIRTFLKTGMIWTISAIALLYIVGTFIYTRTAMMENILHNLPATGYPHALMTLLPIQIVSFGTIGAVIGYWMAVRYQYWRKHECA